MKTMKILLSIGETGISQVKGQAGMHWEIISPNTSKQTSKQHKKTKMKYPQEG
jgi:hypothetical protein